MANNPFGGFGPGTSGNPADWQSNFEALSRQYWGAWGDAMRAASGQPAMPPGMQGWHDAVDWWGKLAHGGRSEANDLVERFNAQARHWFGQMQQVAAQFAGQEHGAAQVAQAWKQALGAAGENPFPEIFRAMRGQHQQGLDQWIEDASPWLDAMRRETVSWLSLPAFGIGREHQERLQSLARAQVDYQERNAAYNALMLKAGQHAFELFEAKLAEREEPGRQLESVRALFDLWIDAAEESYAQIALSPEFRATYGQLVNAQMRLRSGLQREIELATGALGIPTRSEVDAAHRKVAELERELRRLRASTATAPSRGGVQRAVAAEPRKPAKRADKAKQAAPSAAKRAAPAAALSRAAKVAKAAKTPGARRGPAAKRPAPAKAPAPNSRVARAVSGQARKAAPASLWADIARPSAPTSDKGSRR